MPTITATARARRIHVTREVTTPFRGTLGDLDIDNSHASFILMLLGVPPQEHKPRETIDIHVHGTVPSGDVAPHALSTSHSLAWLMDFYDLNSANADAITKATALLRGAIKYDDITSPEAAAKCLNQLAEAAVKTQALAGIRLARAVFMPPGSRIEVTTSCGSTVRCYLSGLAGSSASAGDPASKIVPPRWNGDGGVVR